MSRRTVQILDRQTLWDVAIQEHGSVEGAVLLMLANRAKISSLTSVLTPGEKIKVEGAATDQAVLDYYKKNNLKPVSISDNVDILVGGDYNDDFNNDYFG